MRWALKHLVPSSRSLQETIQSHGGFGPICDPVGGGVPPGTPPHSTLLGPPVGTPDSPPLARQVTVGDRTNLPFRKPVERPPRSCEAARQMAAILVEDCPL